MHTSKAHTTQRMTKLTKTRFHINYNALSKGTESTALSFLKGIPQLSTGKYDTESWGDIKLPQKYKAELNPRSEGPSASSKS
jgi:hypothetical protein